MEQIINVKNGETGIISFFKTLSDFDKNRLQVYLANRYDKAIGTFRNKLSGYSHMDTMEVESIANIINSGEWTKNE